MYGLMSIIMALFVADINANSVKNEINNFIKTIKDASNNLKNNETHIEDSNVTSGSTKRILNTNLLIKFEVNRLEIHTLYSRYLELMK